MNWCSSIYDVLVKCPASTEWIQNTIFRNELLGKSCYNSISCVLWDIRTLSCVQHNDFESVLLCIPHSLKYSLWPCLNQLNFNYTHYVVTYKPIMVKALLQKIIIDLDPLLEYFKVIVNMYKKSENLPLQQQGELFARLNLTLHLQALCSITRATQSLTIALPKRCC
ncbi:hypothetical protein FF38_01492 [Lucilia cuprina]|uniref:Uncharacterized protein n=1 Tax=Lucilia cuprina TaxID=7375 RepID=A0A0L0CKG5_LUCCU|nr:hypothetical protein FF38_01492 [Lucilia cuprina]